MPAEQVKSYRWSSLAGIVRGEGWVDDAGWRSGGRFGAEPDGRTRYDAYLVEVGRDEARWEELGLKGLSKGWAIGSSGWRQTIAKEHGRLALNPGLESAEVREMRELVWEQAVVDGLHAARRTDEQLRTQPMSQLWKLKLADEVQREAGAPVAWLAARLLLGQSDTLRSQLSRFRRVNLQQNSA